MVLGRHREELKINSLQEINLDSSYTHCLYDGYLFHVLNYVFHYKLENLLENSIYTDLRDNNMILLTFLLYNKNSSDNDQIDDFSDYGTSNKDYSYIKNKFSQKGIKLSDNEEFVNEDIVKQLNKETLSSLYFYFYNLNEYYESNNFTYGINTFYYMMPILYQRFVKSSKQDKYISFKVFTNSYMGDERNILSKSLIYKNIEKKRDGYDQDVYNEMNILEKISYLMKFRESFLIKQFKLEKETFTTKLDLVTHITNL